MSEFFSLAIAPAVDATLGYGVVGLRWGADNGGFSGRFSS